MRALVALLFALPLVASAEPRAGLWEFTSQMESGGQAMPDMQQMLGQLQNLPPEQRQMMEQMLAQQGVKLGGAGVQLCLSEERLRAGDIPMQDAESGCTQEVTERGAELWKFRFKCPNGEGEGETRFQGDTAFTTTINGVYDGKPSSMHSQAKWLGADCGGLPSQ
ncbi:DUF3617 domain-containing protein [Pseudomonas sp. CAU 1711]|uniref:DUF3617 domain-containing protein n=1 Tax=Pseudomonas sp. CAU 1711 TaxID=3140356 RepID=UPI003261832A